MPDDYSTPPSPESGAPADWVKGDLPHTPEPTPKKTRPAPPKAARPEAASPAHNGTLSLEALVESLLFVADGAVPVARIAEALEVTPRDVEAALTALGETFRHRGLSLQRFRDKVQLTTASAAAEKVERFLGLGTASHLTHAALETLAIIAYQQPVTRPQIESIRGVNCDSVLKNLLSKGLIEELGRTEGPGRPVLYATTPEFLQYFGLASLSELPPLHLDQPPTLADPQSAGADTAQSAASTPDEVLKG